MRRYEGLFHAFWAPQIREIRKKKSLTQEKMAENIHMSPRNYQKLERGVTTMSGTTLMLLFTQMDMEEMYALVCEFARLVKKSSGREAA